MQWQVKDIYGGDCTSLGLPGDLIASSFGRAAQTNPEFDGFLRLFNFFKKHIL